jgi:hypothetical protein
MSDQDSLDNIVLYCQQYNLGEQNTHDTVSVGQFDFRCRAHSTGNTLCVLLWNKERTERREIVNGTYWFYLRYTFNEFRWEKGAWDKALGDAIVFLQNKVVAHKKNMATKIQADNIAFAEKERLEKLKFEQQFLGAAK